MGLGKLETRKLSAKKCLLLHGLGEVLGNFIPESVVDQGLSQCSDLEFVGHILKKYYLPNRITPQSIIDLVEKNLENCKDNQIQILTRSHSDWPISLQILKDQPYALFYTGQIGNFPRIALIGSRQASLESIEEASKLGYFLAKAGYCVVSGGAIGCDIASHLRLSESKLSQMAMVILPGGILNPYPRLHQPIFAKISLNGGAIVTERLMDHRPTPRDFIFRNRLLVALSDVIVLIQGDECSGSSSTIRMALNYGKEIYVSKSSLFDSPLGQRLVAEGAKLIESRHISHLYQFNSSISCH
jgi:DNA processing protein